MEVKKCLTCRHFDVTYKKAVIRGCCHRYPEPMHAVDSEHWCGEWKKKEGKEAVTE